MLLETGHGCDIIIKLCFVILQVQKTNAALISVETIPSSDADNNDTIFVSESEKVLILQ